MELDSEGLDSPVKVIACKETVHNETAEDYEVEKITGMRLVKGKLWFRVRWKGYGKDLATWEPRANLTHCEELLDDYVSKVQDKKYKQKKRRQTRNALIHTRKKETKDDVVKTKVQALQGNIRRKRFIKKFISKPNKYFTRVPQTKWRMNGGQLEMVNLKTPDELPLETRKETEPTKRGRGRPKKNPTKMPDLQPQTQLCPDREPLETVDDIIVLEDNSIPEPKVEAVVKRCRGRPPKKKIIEGGERLQSDLCVQERTKDIVKKRRKPQKGVVDGGVPKETTDHLWKGQIKLKKVVIRELRSLKALLEFQRQISDEEKENQTDHSEEKPSSMEHRHVHASEYHNRFYIRIKTGSFKDLSTKRRRKRKADKEKRRKKKEAAHKEEQTGGDHEKNELLDKQRGCDEVEEDEDNGYALPDVVEISSSSEGELGDGDSVESQTDAPSLNEEYDEFGYDDFCDFSKDNNNVGYGRKIIDAELPPVLEEREMDGWEIPGDENAAVELNNQQDKSNSRPEQLAEDDATINDEEQEEMEEDDALADESSSLVIPFDEEEESSSLIIGDDGMEDDDDVDEMDGDGSDDEDDLREFGVRNPEIQEPVPSAAMVFTADSLDNKKSGILQEMTKDYEEYQETGHFNKSTEDVVSDGSAMVEKCRSEDIERQQKEKQEIDLNCIATNDFIREENMSKILQSKGIHDNNRQDIPNFIEDKDTVNKTIKSRKVNFSEDSSKKVEMQDSQISTDEEFAKDEEREKEEGTNSASPVPMETDNAVEESITEKNWTKLNEEGHMRASQTPVVGKYTEEEDCAIEMMNSEVFSQRKDKEADNFVENEEASMEKIKEKCIESKGEERGVAQLEPQVTVLSTRKELIKESLKANAKEIDMVCTQTTKEKGSVERDHAIEVINSKIHPDRTDDVGSKGEVDIEEMETECKDNKKEERETKDDLTEPEVMTSSIPKGTEAEVKADTTEMPSDMIGPQGSMEEERVGRNHAVKREKEEGKDSASLVPMETDNAVEESITKKDKTKLKDEGPIRASQLVEKEEDCSVETTNSETLPQKMDEEKRDGNHRKGKEACVEMMTEECNVEEIRETTDGSIEPQVTELSKCKELDRETEVDDMKSQLAVARETARKEVKLDEEVEDKENSVLHRAAENLTQDMTIPEERDMNDDQGEGGIKGNDEEIESVLSGAQENREKELKPGEEVEHVKNTMHQRVVEVIKPDVTIVKERERKGNNDEEGDNNEQTEKKDKEGVSYCKERKEESNDEEREPVIMLSKSKEIEGQSHSGEEMESETACVQETIEKELASNEVESEKNGMLKRDSDNITPDITITGEDQEKQDKKGTKTDDKEMESEMPDAKEITEKASKVEEEVENQNKLPEEECNNVKPKVTIIKEREKEEHCDHGIKSNEERIEEQITKDDTKIPSGLSEVKSKVVGDETDSGTKEMGVEEKEDDRMDSEMFSPGKDETELKEGEDEIDEVTKAEEKQICTSAAENVKDQEIRNVKPDEIDTACNDSLWEAAVAVAKEQRMECKDTQDKDAQGIHLLVKEKEDVRCEEGECNNERSLAESEREAKTTKESKDREKEYEEVDGGGSGEEPAEPEIAMAKDNLHLVGAEKKGQTDETEEKGVEENVEDVLENNCTKDHSTQDREIINKAKKELDNDRLKEKNLEKEVSESCHDNMDYRDDAVFKGAEKDVTDKEEIDPEVEIIDDKIKNEQKNKCNNNKQQTFLDNAESAKNRTNRNLEDVQEALPKKTTEINEKKNNGNSGNIQELALLEKMEADSDDRKARETGRGDRTMVLDEELEEGEIPEEEEKEEDEKDKDIVEDKEEGEITEETEDAVKERERSGEGEETSQVATGGLDSIISDSVKDCPHSQKGESLRRRSREADEVLEISKSNSGHRRTQRDGEKRRTTRSSTINMKRNFNGAYPTKDHKRSKTLDPCDPIAIDDDNDDVEVVEHDIHPKKTSKTITGKNLMESDVYIIDEDRAKCGGTESAEETNGRTFRSERYSKELSPKFGVGIKKVFPTSRSRVCKVDKNGSNAQKLVQSMKTHIQHTVSNTEELGKNGQAVVKNSACKAQGFKLKDSVSVDRGDNLFKRLEGTGGGDAETRAGRGGTKRKSDDDDDKDGEEGSKTRPKKKPAGVSGKEVWQMVTRKGKKPTEPIWEGSPKINRQKIVIKISKKLLTDQPETKEPESNAKRKEPERSSSRNSWKEAKRGEGTGRDRAYPDEQKEKQEKQPSTSRGGRAASTSTGAVGRWSALPKAKPDKSGNDATLKSETNCKHLSDNLLKDLKELKTHGIKQADLPWVRDLLETDHTDCLSEACAALTKFMDSKDQKINLIVEMGFCPLLVKLLRSRSPAVISSALLAVSHIVSGNDYQTQAVLECSPLPLFCGFLSRHKYDVTLKKEACLALSNITAGTSQQIQHLVNDGLFPVLLSAMQHDEFQVMYEATWAVANATVNGSPEQIRYIVKQGFFQAFSEVLKHSDDTLVQIALDAMYNVLKLDTKPKKVGKLTPYCSQVKEYGGLQRIRSVRLTGSTVVKKKAYNMLTTFFPDF